MTSRKKDKSKAAEAPGDAKVMDEQEIAEKAAKVQETDESAAAGFPIVGIGASAGGLAAFEAFFSGMPVSTDLGMAFVLVQHLSPDHESILTNLIRRYTRMEVFEVEDGMVVKPTVSISFRQPRHGFSERHAPIDGTVRTSRPATAD